MIEQKLGGSFLNFIRSFTNDFDITDDSVLGFLPFQETAYVWYVSYIACNSLDGLDNVIEITMDSFWVLHRGMAF